MEVVDQALADTGSVHLLIVSSQTFSLDEKHNVLHHINSSLNQIGAPVLAKKEELVRILKNNSIDSNKLDQEYCTEYKNGVDFDFQLLVNSKASSFRVALQDFFKSTFKRKYLILTTSDYNLHGDIHLQDGVFTYDDMVILANDEEVKRITKENKTSKSFAYINSKLVESNKNWKNLEKSLNIELVAVKPQAVKMDENLNELAACLSKYYNSNVLCHQLETSKLTGTLRITKPSLYIFPGRTGDSAFFTINGFSMLINGGYERVRPCFWKFVNMLQQIDSILITHTDSDALGGLSALFAKKLTNPVDVKPHILTVLGNLIGTKNLPQSDAAAAEMASNLIVNEVSHDAASSSSKSHLSDVDLILDAIDKLKIKLMPLVKTVDNLSSRMNSVSGPAAGSGSKYEHINLYYKLGQGSLDLYVLSPFASSADYKEFVSQQQNRFTKNVHQKSHIAVQNYFRQVPLSHACSAVCLLVWLPAPNKSNPAESNALRLLFTGNAPQHVVFNALDKVKDLDVLTLPVYRQKVESETTSNNNATTTSKAANSNGVSKKAPAPATTNGSSSTVTNSNGTNGTSKPGANNNNNSKQQVANGSHAEPTQSKSNSARASTGVPSSTSSTAASAKSSNLTAASTDSTTVTKTAANSTTTAKPPKSTSNLHSLAGASSAAGADKNKKKPIDGKGDSEQATEVKTEKKTLKSTNATTSSSNLKKDEKGATGGANATAEKKTTTDSAAAATKPAQSKPPVNKTSSATSSKVTSATAASSTVKSGATAASGVTKDATKKTLSLTVTKSASSASSNGAAAAAEAPKKDESKIITKRDKPKEVKPAATNAAAPASAPTPVTPKHTTTGTTQSMASIAIASPPPAALGSEFVSTPQNQVEEPPMASAAETAAAVIVEATSVELATESSEAFPAQVEHEVPQQEETTQPPPSETPVEAAFVHIEESLSKSVDILNNSLNQATDQYNQNQQQNVEEEVARSVGNMHEGGVSHDLLYSNNNESPNLSPVKKDASSNSTLDTHNNHHLLHNGAVNGESSSHENGDCLNGVSENGGALFTNGNYDIMTTSFIEDSSNPDSNPFNGGVSGGGGGGRKINLNESENDLNKTHQLSDDGGDAGGEVEDGEIVESINSLKQNPIVDTDALANVLESLNIQNHQQNNQIHMLNGNGDAAINENDPNSWNLLQLPKPVNPNDVAVNASASASTPVSTSAATNALPDKKSTPNGKKSLSTAAAATANPPQSPLNDVSNKPTTVNRNQSASNLKPAAAKSAPVNPVYLELSYVPAHGNSHYCDVEFFKRVRARHFVFSAEELSENTLNALVDGKETWSGGEDKNLPVSIVPTYESEFLRGWFMANQEKLDRLKIDVMPAANMATVTLDENPEMSCQALKIEF